MRSFDANGNNWDWRERLAQGHSPRGCRSRPPGCRVGPTRPATNRCSHAAGRPASWNTGREARLANEQGGALPAASPSPDLPEVPDSTEMLAMLVRSAQDHYLAGRYESAQAFLELAQEPDIQPATAWRRVGELHFSLGEYEAAGWAYGYATACAPGDPRLHVWLARICLCLGEIPSFEGYLRRALDLAPENAPALQLLADLDRDNGLYDDAARFYRKLIVAQPDHYENLLSLALCYFHLGDSDAAKGWLQLAGRTARGAITPANP
jgi:tetratricopeptide (TPR) repeat protein